MLTSVASEEDDRRGSPDNLNKEKCQVFRYASLSNSVPERPGGPVLLPGGPLSAEPAGRRAGGSRGRRADRRGAVQAGVAAWEYDKITIGSGTPTNFKYPQCDVPLPVLRAAGSAATLSSASRAGTPRRCPLRRQGRPWRSPARPWTPQCRRRGGRSRRGRRRRSRSARRRAGGKRGRRGAGCRGGCAPPTGWKTEGISTENVTKLNSIELPLSSPAPPSISRGCAAC